VLFPCLVLAFFLIVAPGRRAVAGERPFWVGAASVADLRAAALGAEAGQLASRGRLNEAEALLARAAALRPADTVTVEALADLQTTRGETRAAEATFEGLLERSPAGAEPALWLQLGALRAQRGAYREAAAAYGMAVIQGRAGNGAAADVYANLGEVLMADGRLGEAEARYRDAIAVATSETTGERRPRSQDLALAYYGLAVALDRDRQPGAAREAMARALAQDPGGAVLKVAVVPNRDLFFVPDGDVYYYLGLAAEVEGRSLDAASAFGEFLSRRPDSRWAAAAGAHLHPGDDKPRGGAPAGPSPRVVAVGTVQAAGGLAAPLIDAAWRERPTLLDACLAEARGAGSVRIAVDLDIDARGRVTRAALERAGSLGEDFARCAEAAITGRLTVAGPARGKPTHARSEIIIAFP
jgi:tetratricopeptide (TPR) repeat protein